LNPPALDKKKQTLPPPPPIWTPTKPPPPKTPKKNKIKNHDLPAPKCPHPPSKSPKSRPQHTFPLPSQSQNVAIVNFLDRARILRW